MKRGQQSILLLPFDFACKLAEDNGLVDIESHKKLAATYRRGGLGPMNN